MLIRNVLVAGLSLALFSACATIDDHDLKMSDSHRKLAESKVSKGENEAAIKEYLNALGYFPNDPETHFGIAEAYKRKGLYDEAEKHLERALDGDPDHDEARLNLGVVYMLQERWPDAIELFTALAETPSFIRPTRALVNLGWAHYNVGEFDEAKAAFVRALRSDRNNYVARLDLGIVLYEAGQLAEAVGQCNKAAEILETRPREAFGPVEAEVRFRAAQAQIKLGQRTRALEQLRIASERGGKGEWGRKSREYLEVLR